MEGATSFVPEMVVARIRLCLASPHLHDSLGAIWEAGRLRARPCSEVPPALTSSGLTRPTGEETGSWSMVTGSQVSFPVLTPVKEPRLEDSGFSDLHMLRPESTVPRGGLTTAVTHTRADLGKTGFPGLLRHPQLLLTQGRFQNRAKGRWEKCISGPHVYVGPDATSPEGRPHRAHQRGADWVHGGSKPTGKGSVATAGGACD